MLNCFFIYLLAICTSSFENFLSLSLAYFLVWFVCFLFFKFRLFISLYIPGVNPVSDVELTIIFLLFCRLLNFYLIQRKNKLIYLKHVCNKQHCFLLTYKSGNGISCFRAFSMDFTMVPAWSSWLVKKKVKQWVVECLLLIYILHGYWNSQFLHCN